MCHNSLTSQHSGYEFINPLWNGSQTTKPISLLALLQLHLHSRLNIWFQWIGQRQLQDETRNIEVLELGTLHRVTSAVVGRWVTSDQAQLPILPWRKSCALAQLHMIPTFAKENTSFCPIYHQNPAHLCVSYAWSLRDTKMFLKTLSIKKLAHLKNRLKMRTVAETLLGDWDWVRLISEVLHY